MDTVLSPESHDSGVVFESQYSRPQRGGMPLPPPPPPHVEEMPRLPPGWEKHEGSSDHLQLMQPNLPSTFSRSIRLFLLLARRLGHNSEGTPGKQLSLSTIFYVVLSRTSDTFANIAQYDLPSLKWIHNTFTQKTPLGRIWLWVALNVSQPNWDWNSRIPFMKVWSVHRLQRAVTPPKSPSPPPPPVYVKHTVVSPYLPCFFIPSFVKSIIPPSYKFISSDSRRI